MSSTSTLISSNTFNTSLTAGSSVDGSYTDTSNNTAIKIWGYSDQPLQVYVIYADNSAGDNSLSELYPLYANNTVAINSTKKRRWSKTTVTNPTGGSTASRVVVKTRHSIRDPQPVLTYQTDDITLQANFDMDTFEISIASTNMDPSSSGIRVYGGTSSNEYKLILTDASGRILLGTDTTNPISVTVSASESTVGIYGSDGSNQVQQRVDASGRPLVILYDSSGNALTTSNGALNVNIDNFVIQGNSSDGSATTVAVTNCGELITTSPYMVGPVTLYGTATHIAEDTSTSVMTVNVHSRQINLMGQSSQLCELKVQTSPDDTTYYDTIYTILVKQTDTNFKMSVPVTERYIKVVPSIDISLIMKYTY
jgi:hypothetical protein